MRSIEQPFTLRSAAGLTTEPTALGLSALIVIDAQLEYAEGPLALPDVDRAVTNIALLIEAARGVGARVLHVAHRGATGGLFDPEAGGRIMPSADPLPDEIVVQKALPNAFAGTDLAERLAESGTRPLVIAGFMTHMCVSATARAALDLGFESTVVSDATATRPLPSADGGPPLDAQTLHRSALAGLADRFSVVATTQAVLDA